jgi:hypothetical protein
VRGLVCGWVGRWVAVFRVRSGPGGGADGGGRSAVGGTRAGRRALLGPEGAVGVGPGWGRRADVGCGCAGLRVEAGAVGPGLGGGCGRGRGGTVVSVAGAGPEGRFVPGPSLENCTVDASIFVVKLVRAHGGCLGTRSR